MTARARPARKAMIAKVHMARRDLALAEESYRDLLERVTGRRGAAGLSEAQLDAALAEFRRLGWSPKPRRGGRPGRRQAGSPHARKIRALWLSLYHLGAVRDPSESAMAAFVKRQAGVDDPHWLAPEDAASAIEALKDMAARAGVNWAFHKNKPNGERRAVLEAQWIKTGTDRKEARLRTLILGCAREAMLDGMIRDLGVKIRRALAAKAAGEG